MRSLIVTALVASAFVTGVATGLAWTVKSEPLPVRREAPMSERGASILTCPVTAQSLQEYHRICRTRKRMEEVVS